MADNLQLTIILTHDKTPILEGIVYVCICNGYRDADLRALAQQGVLCAHTAYQSLGAGPRCGRCLAVAQQLIDAHAGEVRPAPIAGG